MSLRKCEKLSAPKTLKRVGAWATAAESAVIVFSIGAYPTSKCITCPARMRHGTFRTVCLSSRPRVSLGRAGVHRRDRVDRIPGRDVARVIRPAVATCHNTAVARSDPFARVCGAHHISDVGGAVSVAGVHFDLRHLGGE